jgi:hydrogenase maturation protease
MANAAPRCLVIGIGNPDRGDDAAGRVVARLLRDALPPHVAVLEDGGDATELIGHLAGMAAAYLVDACALGTSPGTVRRFDVGANPLPPGALDLSTHGLGVAGAVELARALGQLPSRCVIYAIEGGSFEIGAPLSPAVAEAVADVVAQIRGELAGTPGLGDQTRCTMRI